MLSSIGGITVLEDGVELVYTSRVSDNKGVAEYDEVCVVTNENGRVVGLKVHRHGIDMPSLVFNKKEAVETVYTREFDFKQIDDTMDTLLNLWYRSNTLPDVDRAIIEQCLEALDGNLEAERGIEEDDEEEFEVIFNPGAWDNIVSEIQDAMEALRAEEAATMCYLQ
jgi:hypothetical protein